MNLNSKLILLNKVLKLVATFATSISGIVAFQNRPLLAWVLGAISAAAAYVAKTPSQAIAAAVPPPQKGQVADPLPGWKDPPTGPTPGSVGR